MRSAYIVAYDIADPKRLRRVAQLLLGFGNRVQYSVFRCELNPRERAQLRTRLDATIHHMVDQVLFIELGPVGGQTDDSIFSLGRPYLAPDRGAIVL